MFYSCASGLGIGLSYEPSLVVIGTYFEKRRGLANGMAFASGSLGAFVFPQLIKYLLDTYGLNGTFFIMGGIVFHVSVAGMLFRPPEFYVPRYLMKQKWRHFKATEMQPDVVIYTQGMPDDIELGFSEESYHAAGSVVCNKRDDDDAATTPEVTFVMDSQSQTIDDLITCSNSTIPHDEREISVPQSDIIEMHAMDASIRDGDAHVHGSESGACVASDNDTIPSQDALSVLSDTVKYNWNTLKNPILYIYVISLSLSDSSFSNAFTMMPPHATEIGISKVNGAFLVSVLGITDGISRLLTGGMADLNVIEKKHIYKASVGLCGLVFFIIPLFKQFHQLVIVCGLCGFFAGSFVVLAPILLAEELGSVNIPVTYGVMYR